MQLETLLESVLRIAEGAGDKILEVYERDDFETRIKSDNSPLTAADMASHHHIVDALTALTPEIPVLSEESKAVPFAERAAWQRYWLVDPLDGTKEFVARNGEFTVNIALIEGHKAILGVVGVPARNQAYCAAKGLGAWRIDNGERKAIRVRSVPERDGNHHFTVVASRRSGLDKVEQLVADLPGYELTNIGSALKICLVAEGEADLYPRLAPTSEWDTAAAQAVVEEAGGLLTDTDFKPLQYNTKDSILNPHFLVLGDPDLEWQRVLTTG